MGFFRYMVALSHLVGMHKENEPCYALLEETASALDDEAVTVMLLAIQRENLEMSVKSAVQR